jgi:hypothetical protein
LPSPICLSALRRLLDLVLCPHPPTAREASLLVTCLLTGERTASYSQYIANLAPDALKQSLRWVCKTKSFAFD